MIKVTIVRSERIPACIRKAGLPGQISELRSPGGTGAPVSSGIPELLADQRIGRINMIQVEGHAGFNKPGKDIVCAAASVTAYTCAGAISELTGIGRCHTETEGFLEISLPDGCWEDDSQRRVIDTISEAACIGFRQIEGSYPRHLRVIES